MATPASATTSIPPRVVFMMPPPMTVYLHFDDGTQIGVTPSPERLAASIFGIPFYGGGFPMMQAPGMFGGGLGGLFDHRMQEEGMLRAIHELFVRSQSEQQGPPPTSKAFLDKIPCKTWTAASKATEKHCDCPICLCEYEENDEVLPLPCGHLFHKECGMKWLVGHNVCPTCRHELPTHQEENAKLSATTQVPTGASGNEPESEPDAEVEPSRASRIRQRPPHPHPERLVRRRLSERDSILLPGAIAANEEDALESMLEEEAERLVAEELCKRRNQEVDFDDVDVEELLRETASN